MGAARTARVLTQMTVQFSNPAVRKLPSWRNASPKEGVGRQTKTALFNRFRCCGPNNYYSVIVYGLILWFRRAKSAIGEILGRFASRSWKLFKTKQEESVPFGEKQNLLKGRAKIT